MSKNVATDSLSEYDKVQSKKKEIAKKMRMRAAAAAFEKKINVQEKEMLRDRAKRVKKGGFKSEREYFEKANPFKNYDK